MKYSLTREPVILKFEDKYDVQCDHLTLSLYDGKNKVFSTFLDFEKIRENLIEKYKDTPEKQKQASYQKGLDDASFLVYTKLVNLFFSYSNPKEEIEKLIKGGDALKLV